MTVGWEYFLASLPVENVIVWKFPLELHPCFPVFCLLRPMLGRQEASPHFRYVKRVLDPDCVLFAIIVDYVKLESPFALDC